MADVTIVVRSDEDGLRREAEALRGAMRAGIDLGPRGPHIRALGRALQDQLLGLRGDLSLIPQICDRLQAEGLKDTPLRRIEAELDSKITELLQYSKIAIDYRG